MKLYEVEVVAKITVNADSALQAKERAVVWTKEKMKTEEATWLSCEEAKEESK
jgi:hypothetical protein